MPEPDTLSNVVEITGITDTITGTINLRHGRRRDKVAGDSAGSLKSLVAYSACCSRIRFSLASCLHGFVNKRSNHTSVYAMRAPIIVIRDRATRKMTSATLSAIYRRLVLRVVKCPVREAAGEQEKQSVNR